jgi:hypothetical protein
VAAIQRKIGWRSSLDIDQDLPGIGLIPAPIEVLGHHPKLNNQITGYILRLDLAALFPPEPDERLVVIAYDDPGIGAANEIPTVRRPFFPQALFHPVLLVQNSMCTFHTIWNEIYHAE